MEIENKRIEELGPIDIIREALDLLATHSKCFILIQVRLLLPLLIFAATATFFDWQLPLHDPQSPLGTTIIPNLPRSIRDVLYENEGLLRDAAMVSQVLVLTVDFIILTCTVSISLSSTVYAVGLNYISSEGVSFEHVVHACLPRLWMRLTLTIVYNVVITCAVVMVLSLCTDILLLRNHAPGLMMVLGVNGLRVVVFVAAVILDMLFTLAWSVTVLEKDYGWAAVRRARKLLRGRWRVALSIQMLAFVPNFLLVAILIPIENQRMPEGLSSVESGTTFFLERLLLTNCFTSSFFQMKGLCAGVQYASFKAYQMKENPGHYEEIVYEKAGYDLVPGEVVEVLRLGESKATESFV